MRHILIYILSVVMIACSSQLYAQDIMRHEKKQRVSIGIKGGFNSTMTFTDEISYGDQDITDIQNNYKVGYIATLFTRINLIKSTSYNRKFRMPFHMEV